MKALLIVGVLAATSLAGAAGACKVGGLNCRASSIPLLSRLVSEGDPLRPEDPGTDATSLPDGFRQEVLASGLELPSAFTLLPDGRILIAEKNGLVRTFADGRLLPRPFVDLRDRVADWGLRGLVAIHAHPNFARNGWVYVLYARKPSGEPEAPTFVHVSRLKAVGDTASPSSEEVVLGREGVPGCAGLPATADCIPLDGDHGGGQIVFANDGTMLVSTGDGHGAADPNEKPLRAQDLDRLSGKVLRVTPEGKGVEGNPFWTADPRANRSKVWAYGLRNPFRFTLDRGEERLWLGDVGWDTAEEINEILPGENYGWPCYEARERLEAYAGYDVCRALERRRDTVRMPLLSYPAASITGGVFLDGNGLPARYGDAYLFGDWFESWLRLVPAAAGDAAPEVEPFAEDAAGPVEIVQAPDGSIVYLALNAGELRRITYSG